MSDKKNPFESRRFPGQKEGECIRLIIRKHWIIDVKIGLALVVIGALPLLLAIAGGFLSWDGTMNDIFLTTMFGFLLYFLAIILVAYVKWLNEELDVIVATDERVVSHEQINLFHRQVSETSIAQIQDVKGVENGIFQSILHYGTIEIQTASSDVFFLLKYINEPYHNARALLDLRDAYLHKFSKKSAPA